MKNIDGKSLIIGLLTGIIAMLLMGSKTLESPGMYQMECNAELCFVMNTLNGVARSLTYSGLIRDRQNPLFTEMNERYLESNEIMPDRVYMRRFHELGVQAVNVRGTYGLDLD